MSRVFDSTPRPQGESIRTSLSSPRHMASPTEQSPSAEACPKCGGERDSRRVNVVETECWSCHEPMNIAFGGATGGPSPHPGDFTEAELAAAREAGAKLELRFSKTTQSEYLANVCPHCNQITGDFFLHDYWYLASDENEVSVTFECRVCDRGLRPLCKPRPRRARKQPGAPVVVPSAVAPTPRRERRQLWGKCGSCGQPASPIQVTDGTFYCGLCHRQAAFIPDP